MEELRIYFQNIVALSDQSWNEISEVLKSIHFEKNEILLQQGTICRDIFFIKEGIARVFHLDQNGREITTRFVFANQMTTSFYGLISGKVTRENIKTITEGVAYSIPYERLLELYDKHRDVERLGRLILEDYFIRRESRMVDLQSLTAPERYDKLIKDHPQILQTVPLGFIASYLGITQETLSRIRNKR